VRRIRDATSTLGPLEVADAIARAEGIKLSDSAGMQEVLARISDSAVSASENPTVLHGKRVEAMFGYVAASLGKCSAIKKEDSGDAFVDATDDVRLPDYRLRTASGEEFFVEVKNCHLKDPEKAISFRTEYVASLERYTTIWQKELKFAIYWSRWRKWALLSPSAFTIEGDRLQITLLDAFKKNEMVTLGDLTLGTVPPLRMRIVTNPDKPRRIIDGVAKYTILRVEWSAGDVEIVDRKERALLFYLMAYGDWVGRGPDLTVDGDELIHLDFLAEPREEEEYDPRQGFTFVGELSRMISVRYNELTTDGRTIERLEPPVSPSSLVAAIPGKVSNMDLPLWVFRLSPG